MQDVPTAMSPLQLTGENSHYDCGDTTLTLGGVQAFSRTGGPKMDPYLAIDAMKQKPREWERVQSELAALKASRDIRADP